MHNVGWPPLWSKTATHSVNPSRVALTYATRDVDEASRPGIVLGRDVAVALS